MASISFSCHTADLSRLQGHKYSKEFGGFRFLNPLATNKNVLTLGSIGLRKTSCFSVKGDNGVIAAQKSDIEVVIAQKSEEGAIRDDLIAGESFSINGLSSPNNEIQADEFFVDNGEFDLDCPTEGFDSIAEALEDIRQGKFVIVVDDEGRENEGDLIMAASLVKPEDMAFLVKHGTGIVCVSMKEEDLERLQLPLMVAQKENEEKLSTAFTVSVDAKEGTTTGVSAKDRAKTILALASHDSKPEDFNRPGHIFPLKYREGGVLKRAGHTEASVDLAMLAGLDPVGVLCEIVDDDDGSMARLPKLREFAKKENLKLVSIADLIRYRRKRDKLVERSAHAPIPTTWGPFQAYCYRSHLDGIEHIAMVKGQIGDGQDVLVRVHSECLTGDIFGSARCDCGNQLALAMHQIEKAGRGVLVYLRGHEGRGIGLGHKLRAYNLQDDGRDTVEANEELGLPVDSREYGVGAQILRDLGVHTMKLMTNNPSKYTGLKGYGLSVVGRVPLLTMITADNRRYLETKRLKMGHVYGSEFNGLTLAPLVIKVDPNLNVILTASLTVYVGCYRSVKPTPPTETMSNEHAMRFPLVGSAMLLSLFLLFKFLSKDLVNAVLTCYFFILGIIALSATLLPAIKRFLPQKWNEDLIIWRFPYFRSLEVEFTKSQIVAAIPGTFFCAWYASQKHWLANNILGLAFCVQGIEMLSLGSFKTGAILLAGLFVYDIFWVFFTPVMVSVAKSFDAPIKLLFPTADSTRPYSMLGLGDIVIPGIFVALALRFDVSRGKENRYFRSAFSGYTVGLILTIVVMNWFQAAQPALLYIVPAVTGFVAVHCIWNGEVKPLLEFDESKTADSSSDTTSLQDGETSNSDEKPSKKDQ